MVMQTPSEAVEFLIRQPRPQAALKRLSLDFLLGGPHIQEVEKVGFEALQQDLVQRFMSNTVFVAELLDLSNENVEDSRRIIVQTSAPHSISVGVILTEAVDDPRLAIANYKFAGRWHSLISLLMSLRSNETRYDEAVENLQKTRFFDSLPVLVAALPLPQVEETRLTRLRKAKLFEGLRFVH